NVSCWQKITGSVYQEQSLVFRPGFSIATLALEANTIENNNAYNLTNVLKRYMSEDTTKTDKSKESDCDCKKKGTEGVDQASGTIPNQAQCPPGHVWVREGDGGSCQPVDETGNAKSDAGSKGVAS